MSWKLPLIFFWSVHFAFWADLVIAFGSVSLVLTVLTSKFISVTIDGMREEIEELSHGINPENLDLIHEKRELFFDHLNRLMQLAQLIRKCNPFLRVAIGSCVTWFTSASLFYIYCVFFVPLPPIIVCSCSRTRCIFLIVPFSSCHSALLRR